MAEREGHAGIPASPHRAIAAHIGIIPAITNRQLLAVSHGLLLAVDAQEQAPGLHARGQDDKRQAGAVEVLDYPEDPQDFGQRIRELTDGKGVNVVYDGVGQATFDRSLKSLAIRGTMVLFGAASGPVPEFDLQRLNSGGSLFITRPTLWNYLLTAEERNWRWSELTDAVIAGKLDVRIGGTYPLADAAQAHDDLAGRKTTGKLLLLP